MARRTVSRAWMPAALGMAICLPALSRAQATPALNPGQVPADSAPAVLGGASSIDLISIRAGSFGAPLRHGAVVPGSERVSLDGRTLASGQEYSMDYEAGVVYLMVAARAGQSLSVSYRYDPGRPKDATNAFAGIQALRFNVAPGSLSMVMGLGMTERTADGAVLRSNVYGLNNSFSFNGSNLKGVFMVGDREQVSAESAFEYQGEAAKQDAGQSKAVVQALQGNLLGGTIEADYQDVTKNFTGFNALREGGYDDGAVNQLAKERGLTRMGLSLKDVQLGGLGFSHSTRSIEDGSNSIDWRSWGVNTGALKVNWRSQTVDSNFNRFKDLREEDRQQLAKEAGLHREWMDGAWALGFGSLSFASSLVEDENKNGISKQEVKLDSSKFKFAIGEQEVSGGFTRFNSLFEPERGQWGKEAGLKRQWQSLEAALFGSAGKPLKFSAQRIDSTSGSLAAIDTSLGGGTWSLEHVGRSITKGFSALGNLPQEELDGHINAISRMYEPGGVPLRPEERGWFLRSAGIERSMSRLAAKPFKGWDLGFETLALQGQEDDARVDSFKLAGAGLALSYRHQDLGDRFSELTSLMEFERQRLGNLSGLERTDIGVNANLGAGKLEFAQTDADTPQGGMDRRSLKYSDRQLQVAVNSREVDPGFQTVGQMLDPERDLLPSLVGFKQTDTQIKWQALDNLRIEAMGFQGENDLLGHDKDAQRLFVQWSPDSITQFEYTSEGTKIEDPMSVLFAHAVERLSMSRSFGRYGALRLAQTKVDFSGTQAAQPDSVQQLVAYETQIDDRTKVKTEQVRTRFQDGDKEDVSAHTISTELSNAVGLNLTDVTIDRGGKGRDEKRRAFGGWLYLGHGVRLNLGMTEHANQVGSGTSQGAMSLTPGTIDNLQIASASYNANHWEQANRVQAMSNIGLSTVKPFDLGFFKDVKLSMSQESAADHGKWLRENRALKFDSRVGSNVLGFEYRGQMDNLEQRAVDRVFTFNTAQDPKARFQLAAFYKHRTLPGGDNVAIRNWSLTARPSDRLQIQHQMTTNPEAPRGDVLLGSVAQPGRVNKWKLDWTSDPNCKLSGSWEELRNDDNDALSQIGGITLTLFEQRGSPLSLFYGIERLDGNVPKRSVDRWSLRYNQTPGPNQIFSLYLGTVTYGYTVAPNERRHNLNVQLEYQWRF